MTLNSQSKPLYLISTDLGHRFRSDLPKFDFQVVSNWSELEISWKRLGIPLRMSILCWYQFAMIHNDFTCLRNVVNRTERAEYQFHVLVAMLIVSKTLHLEMSWKSTWQTENPNRPWDILGMVSNEFSEARTGWDQNTTTDIGLTPLSLKSLPQELHFWFVKEL